ncbi:FIST N-terminal domain-containing protein [Desulfobacter postgatei]|uniref:FIST N-terminal domain-containing protein n=1 Tax=Desulfobacter postgatei TaxID=2293 RepID=UPI00259B9DF3|nr:FIST N-terminal domain-containing protein [uncultured Desulfobacter sp.]
MKILIDEIGHFSNFEKQINELISSHYRSIMIFHAEGGIDSEPKYKQMCDKALVSTSKNDVNIFGGIFPGIFDNGTLMQKGSILVGIKSDVHVITLENLNNSDLYNEIEQKLAPISDSLINEEYKTLFVYGDGFGENNHNLINGLNQLVKKYPMNVIGELTGRDKIKSSHYTIFTPAKIIQNGAVLAFTKLESGIGVQHGWEPLIDSELEITKINDCFVEEINGAPALDFYMHIITGQNKEIYHKQEQLLKDRNAFFSQVAVKYPLGLIRKEKGTKKYIDRTPISVGADKSLQFSAQIPAGTKTVILHLKGNSPKTQCSNLTQAVKQAYKDCQDSFPDTIKQKRVIIMDCFGRKNVVESMGKRYSDIEFKDIAEDQKNKVHSPIGPLTIGEISSMPGNYVELHNKTAVVGLIEDN